MRHLFLGMLLLSGLQASEEGKPLFELGLMGAAFSLPHYRASDESDFRLLPLPYFVYRGKFFQSKDGNFKFGRETERWDYGLSFFINPSTEASDARQGMQELGNIIEVGPSLTYHWRKTERSNLYHSARVRVTSATPDSELTYAGLQFEILSGLKFFLDDKKTQRLQSNFKVLFGDDKRHDYFYSVEMSESTPNRPSYNAKSGYAGSSFDLIYAKEISPIQTFLSFMRLDFNQGSAYEESPLYKKDVNISAGLLYIYKLYRSVEKVPR